MGVLPRAPQGQGPLAAAGDRALHEYERRRLARELHDEIGQVLTGLKLDFAAVLPRLRALKAPGDVVDRLQSITGQIDISIEIVRRIAGDLSTALFDPRDLSGAIERHARKITVQAGIPITASVGRGAVIPPAAASTAFRIFLEAVTNATRHANATAITVTLSTPRGRALVLRVQDNGTGIDRARLRPGHLGLVGMRERARACGGRLRVSSRPKQGTTVTVTLPLGPGQ